MLKSVQSFSRHLFVSQGPNPPIYNYSNLPSAGTVRYNINSHDLEVYDGNTWYNTSTTVGVSMSPDAESAIEWVQKKMKEEAILKEKMEKYPTLKAAYEQFKTIEALVYEEEVANG